jgi:molecular chaperone HscB
MDPCSHCQSRLETPLVCLSCHRMVPVDRAVNPYVAFGLPLGYALDKDALRRTQSRLTRLMHPDFFGGGDPDARALAERNTSELNRAYEILKDDASRADWLVRELGGPSQDALREMPREFLMEVLEWNEALEEARGTDAKSAERARLAPLRAELTARRAALMDKVARALDPLPAHGDPRLADVRRDLNAVRYLDRALSELSELLLFCTPR